MGAAAAAAAGTAIGIEMELAAWEVHSTCPGDQSYPGSPCIDSAAALEAVAVAAGACPSPVVAWETQCIAVEAEAAARSRSAEGRKGRAVAVPGPVAQDQLRTGSHTVVGLVAGYYHPGRRWSSSTSCRFGVRRRGGRGGAVVTDVNLERGREEGVNTAVSALKRGGGNGYGFQNEWKRG